MNLTKIILKQLLLRLYMIVGAGFITYLLIFAHYNQPSWLYVLGACMLMPVNFIALWNFAGTISNAIKIKENFAKIKANEVKEQNKEYLKKL